MSSHPAIEHLKSLGEESSDRTVALALLAIAVMLDDRLASVDQHLVEVREEMVRLFPRLGR
jgi:hypothetical protein